MERGVGGSDVCSYAYTCLEQTASGTAHVGMQRAPIINGMPSRKRGLKEVSKLLKHADPRGCCPPRVQRSNPLRQETEIRGPRASRAAQHLAKPCSRCSPSAGLLRSRRCRSHAPAGTRGKGTHDRVRGLPPAAGPRALPTHKMNTCPSQGMKYPPCTSRLLCCSIPGFSEVPDKLLSSVKDRRAYFDSALYPPLHMGYQGRSHGKGSSFTVFGIVGFQTNLHTNG
jgi:hypothetical protein